jgi:hypothetical protein
MNMSNDNKFLWAVSVMMAFVVGMLYGMHKGVEDLNMDRYCETKKDGITICVFPWQDPERGNTGNTSTGRYN